MSEQTLQQALEQFHEAGADGTLRDPHLVLWQLLNRFVAVCNAVAQAHSKGNLHGEIRPEDIVLGPYGETQVIGWGLAKQRNVNRTPIYMSPEQAEGRSERVSPASDIYCLGATLYALLTGEAPFPGKQVDEVLNNIKRGEFLWPRQKKNDVPRALEKICLKAMARQPEKRYATASELAADLEYWLADESASAYCRPWRRKGRWGRHHRRVLAGAAALLLMAVVAFSLSMVQIRQHEQAARSAFVQAERNLRLAREVADKTVTAVTASPKGKETDSRPLRCQLLASMLPLYEQLLMHWQDDHELKAARGQALHALTLLNHEIAKSKTEQFNYQYELIRLRSDYELVRGIFSQLAADFPDVLPYRLELVSTLTDLANLLREMYRRRHWDMITQNQGEAACRDALRIRAQLAADFPTVPQYRQELARYCQ